MSDDFLELTTDFDEPYFDGTRIEPSSATALPIGIDGRGFMWDNNPQLPYDLRYQRQPINLLNSQQASSEGDSAQVPPEIWRRVVDTWVKGQGQSNSDRKDSQPERYYRSRNIDPFEPWEISLIHGTEQFQALTAGDSFMVAFNGNLVVAHGTDLTWYVDDLIGPGTDTLGDAVIDMTTDGESLFVLTDAGDVIQYTDVATSSTFATVSVTAGRMLLRYLKGFLVVGAANFLYDISSGTPETIYEHPLSSWTWRDAAEGSDSSFLLGGQGDRWHVASMAIKDDGTTFDVPVLNAGFLPDGEEAFSISSYGGYLMVGSRHGWRFGVADGNGNLQFGRLIDTNGPVYCFEGQDRFVWYGTSDVDETGLGRADLSTFAGPVTPAVASDLRAGVAGTVRWVTTFADKRVFLIEGDGVYTETDELAEDGWLEQGTMNFGTSDRKVGSYVQVYMEPLEGQLLVEASLDGRDYGTLALASGQGSVSIGKAPLEQAFDTLQVRFTLTRDSDDPTLGPVVTRLEARATPIAGNASEWRLPLLLSDTINVGTGTDGRSTGDDYDFLMSLVQSKRYFTLREGLRTRTVHATDYRWVPDKLDTSSAWFTGLFLLIVREVA